PLSAGPGSVEQLEQRQAAPRCNAQAEYGSELARLAWQHGEAFRVCVRLITPRRELVPIGHAGPPDSWSPQFLTTPQSLDGPPSAAGQAIDTASTYVVDDVDNPPGPLLRVPPATGSHASIPLRALGHVLGVMSVDWKVRGDCPPLRP